MSLPPSQSRAPTPTKADRAWPETEKVINTACGRPARNDGNKDRAIYWSLFAVTMVSFGCRMLARTDRFGGTMWWDDYFIVASSAVAFAVTVGAEISQFPISTARWRGSLADG